MKIGVVLESFQLPYEDAIKKAVELGVEGIQFYGVNGELDCDELTLQQKRSFKELMVENHLEISAVCADIGGHGFAFDDNMKRIEKTKRCMDFARFLDCSVITTHVGVIPDQPCEIRDRMVFAMKTLGIYSDETGVKIAIETGSETCKTLKGFLQEVDHKSVGVNFDPANLVMVLDDDPIEGVALLKDDIIHTHAKDGIMLKKTNPTELYNYFAEGGIEDFHLSDYFIEKPLGEGQVDLKKWVNKLKEIGYNGFLTIERETGENPAIDVQLAVSYLQKLAL